MAEQREETAEEFKIRMAFQTIFDNRPQDIVFMSCLVPNRRWKAEADKAIANYWGKAAPVLKILISEGAKLGRESGVDSSDWWKDIPKYDDAKDEWDFLEKHLDVVKHIFEDAEAAKLLSSQAFSAKPSPVNSGEEKKTPEYNNLNLLSRIFILVLCYNFIHTAGEPAEEKPDEELLLNYYDDLDCYALFFFPRILEICIPGKPVCKVSFKTVSDELNKLRLRHILRSV